MPKPTTRTLSSHTLQVLSLYGKLIRETRLEKRMTSMELSERANISRGLLQRIEKGDPSCSLGAAFEVAWVLGLRLFDADESSLAARHHELDRRLALLLKRVTPPDFDDDF